MDFFNIHASYSYIFNYQKQVYAFFKNQNNNKQTH